MKVVDPTKWSARVHCGYCGVLLELALEDLTKVAWGEIRKFNQREFTCCECNGVNYVNFPEGACGCHKCCGQNVPYSLFSSVPYAGMAMSAVPAFVAHTESLISSNE